MPFPIKVCAICSDEFELKPDKPGLANRCPQCSQPESDEPGSSEHLSAEERKAQKERDAERRRVMRDLLYRKDR